MTKDIQEIKTIMAELSEIRPAHHADLLIAAIQVQRNRMLKRALMLSDSDSYPGALEKIAMELADGGKDLSRIESTLDDIDRKLGSIDTSVSNIENQD